MADDLKGLIAEVEQALAQATPGPWISTVWEPGQGCVFDAPKWLDFVEVSGNEDDELDAQGQANARLIAYAPSWLSALLSALRTLEQTIDAVTSARDVNYRMMADAEQERALAERHSQTLSTVLDAALDDFTKLQAIVARVRQLCADYHTDATDAFDNHKSSWHEGTDDVAARVLDIIDGTEAK